jgi:hypothetical protein
MTLFAIREAKPMDPQTVIYDLLEAMNRNDREAIAEHLETLDNWNKDGGFWPYQQSSNLITAFVVKRYSDK